MTDSLDKETVFCVGGRGSEGIETRDGGRVSVLMINSSWRFPSSWPLSRRLVVATTLPQTPLPPHLEPAERGGGVKARGGGVKRERDRDR